MQPQASLQPVAEAISARLGLRFVTSAGAGTFKETYEVLDQQGNRLALKVFRPALISERTEREIDAMRRCNHPNIARVIAVDNHSHGGQQHLYLIEAFLPGGSLLDRVTRAGRFSPDATKELARALVDALGHIAALDLVHRDFKPENILLDAADNPIVDDFGIVRDLKAQSLTQSWLLSGPGTPLYASPEQLNNEKELIDWRTDQFSLGVLLSAVALGIHPYAVAGMTAPQIIDAVALKSGPTADFVHDATAAGLNPLVKMVAAWPVQRYRTPELLATAWEAL